MAVPFSSARVTRFLCLWVIALSVVIGLFVLLMHVRARQGILPNAPQSRLHSLIEPSGPRLG